MFAVARTRTGAKSGAIIAALGAIASHNQNPIVSPTFTD